MQLRIKINNSHTHVHIFLIFYFNCMDVCYIAQRERVARTALVREIACLIVEDVADLN